MKNPFWASLSCALLLAFSAFTNAAPPLNSQSSGQLSLVNANATVAALHNITLPDGSTRLSFGAPFTPGPQPEENPLFYDVPFSDPPMNIKFRDYFLDAERDESDVEKCFQQAILECSDPRKHNREMEHETDKVWESGRSYLQVRPSKGNHDQEASLTYGMFVDALRGMNNFRLFYPHLDFGYEIYVYVGEEGKDENYVGRGQLFFGGN